jgi:hypothetical protein
MTDAPSCDHAWALDIHRGAERVRCMLCGVLAHASPTQLEDWRACNRRWKYRRLRKIFPVPENEWAAFGSRAHVIREHWLKSGTWTAEIAASKEGQCVAAGIEYWPRPGVALAVEVELDKIDLLGDGIPWTFKIDDIAPPTHHYDLGDLKTIGRIEKRKTVDDLIEDAQRVVYSVWGGPILQRDTIRSAWSYCQRSPPNMIPTVVESRVADDRQRLHVINNESGGARDMIAANLRPLDEQDRNRETCYKYRGYPCVYASHCLADQNDLDIGGGGLYTSETMTNPVPTLADALAASAGGAALPPMPGAAPALPPIPVAPSRIVLTPELEQWVQSCVAAGHDEATIRPQAEKAMGPSTVVTAQVAAQAVAPVVAVAQPVQQPPVTHAIATLGNPASQEPPPVTGAGGGGAITAPTTTRRTRTPKATDATTQSVDVRMIAATLAARAVSGPTSAGAVVDMYFDVLELLAEGGK